MKKHEKDRLRNVGCMNQTPFIRPHKAIGGRLFFDSGLRAEQDYYFTYEQYVFVSLFLPDASQREEN